jgi:hypothetical protein
VSAFKRFKRIKERTANTPTRQSNIDLIQEEHINFVDLATEELPATPQVVVVDPTMDPTTKSTAALHQIHAGSVASEHMRDNKQRTPSCSA